MDFANVAIVFNGLRNCAESLVFLVVTIGALLRLFAAEILPIIRKVRK